MSSSESSSECGDDIYSLVNRLRYLVHAMLDIDGNSFIEELDFACLALRNTILEEKGEFSNLKYEEHFHIMMNLWAEMAAIVGTDIDDRISCDDLAEAVRTACQGKTFDQLPQAMKMFAHTLFKAVDTNEDGVIDLQEFRVDCVRRIALPNVDLIDECFDTLCTEDDLRRGGICKARFEDLFTDFINNPNSSAPAVRLMGPLPLPLKDPAS